MAVKSAVVTPEDVRKKMLQNTAIMKEYAQQMQKSTDELIQALNDFREDLDND